MAYFIYNGVEYDAGTKVKIKTYYYGEQIMTLEDNGVTGKRFVCTIDNSYDYSIPIRSNTEQLIIEIVAPVYPQKQEILVGNNRDCPPSWDVEIGWVWYIIIIAVGTIFKDRLLIWGTATAIFFLWKSGFLNGGKK